MQLHLIPFLLPAQILLGPLDQTSQLTINHRKLTQQESWEFPAGTASWLIWLRAISWSCTVGAAGRSTSSRSVLPGSRETLSILNIQTENHCRRKRKKEQRRQHFLHQMEQCSEEEVRMADFYNNAPRTKPLAERETLWIQGPEHNLIVDYWLKYTGLLHYKGFMLFLHTKVSQLTLVITVQVFFSQQKFIGNSSKHSLWLKTPSSTNTDHKQDTTSSANNNNMSIISIFEKVWSHRI